MCEDVPESFIKVLAEWLFVAIIRKLEASCEDDLIDLLILYSWATYQPGNFHPTPKMAVEALKALEKAGYFSG